MPINLTGYSPATQAARYGGVLPDRPVNYAPSAMVATGSTGGVMGAIQQTLSSLGPIGKYLPYILAAGIVLMVLRSRGKGRRKIRRGRR
jgi:hypothetical protein